MAFDNDSGWLRRPNGTGFLWFGTEFKAAGGVSAVLVGVNLVAFLASFDCVTLVGALPELFCFVGEGAGNGYFIDGVFGEGNSYGVSDAVV